MTVLAYVSLGPYYFVAFLIVILGMVALMTPATKRSRLKRRLLIATALSSGAFFLAFVYPAPFLDVERVHSASATWAIYADEDGRERVDLRDTSSTQGWVVESPALSAYLREKMPPQVTVKYSGFYDYGSLRATGVPATVDSIGVSYVPTTNAPRQSPPVLRGLGFPVTQVSPPGDAATRMAEELRRYLNDARVEAVVFGILLEPNALLRLEKPDEVHEAVTSFVQALATDDLREGKQRHQPVRNYLIRFVVRDGPDVQLNCVGADMFWAAKSDESAEYASGVNLKSPVLTRCFSPYLDKLAPGKRPDVPAR